MSSITIEDLPPEILLYIFEYVPGEDLINVLDVSIKWREFARTTSVWDNFVYSPDRHTSDEDVIKVLEKCPMLKHIHMDRIPDKHILLPAVIKYCSDIHSFCVGFTPTLTISEIDTLFDAYPNLDYFLIRIDFKNAAPIVDRVSKCTKLKKLILSGQCLIDGVFKPIVDGCVSLEYLSFNGGFPNVSQTDLLYVLKNMNERLLCLKFGLSPTTQELVNLLGTFTKLKQLSLHDDTLGQVVNFSPLSNIKTLRCLTLESFARNKIVMCRFLDCLFENPFPHLEKLDICLFHCQYDKSIFTKICQCYQNLKHLRLNGSRTDDFEDGFKYLCMLKKLESLGLASSNTITDDNIAYVGQCYNLKTLDLSSNRLLTDKTLFHLSKCEKLESLDLSYCLISGQNLHLIVDNLKKLKILYVIRCKNLQESCVRALADLMPSLKIITT